MHLWVDGYIIYGDKKSTSTETHVLNGTNGMYRPVCYRTHILSVMGQAWHMLHMGLIWLGDTMNNNKEWPMYGRYKIYDWNGYDLYYNIYATHVI